MFNTKLLIPTVFIIFAIFFSFTLTDTLATSSGLLVDLPRVDTRTGSSISPDNTSDLIVDSKFMNVNLDALDLDEITISLFDNTYTIQKNYIDIIDSNHYVWAGEGDSSIAILSVFGSHLYGTLYTDDGTFTINPTLPSSERSTTHTVSQTLAGELLIESSEDIYSSSSTTTSASAGDWAQIRLLELTYNPNTDYSAYDVEVDVYFIVTDAADNENSRLGTFLSGQIDKANYANKASKLPVTFKYLDTDDVRYVEESSVQADLNSFDVSHADYDSIFTKYHTQAKNANADIVVLITNPGTDAADIDGYTGCGQAKDLVSQSADGSILLLAYACLDGTTLTHEMGHLFGAGHNKDVRDFGNENAYKNSLFDSGHGYYDVNNKVRTVMSYDCDAETWSFDGSKKNPTCSAGAYWSDPNNNFFGTVAPTGVANDKDNAKVVFSTAPYIGSLRGATQTYDTIDPIGAIVEAVTDYYVGDLLDIVANFNEDIHDGYPPYVTISDSSISTTTVMVKSTSSKYTLSHQLTDEVGDVTMSFSNARDLYGNPIESSPSSGSSITVVAPDTTDPVITLTGNTSITVEAGSTYSEPGASCTDDVDGSITVTTSGSVNTSKLGSYTLSYDCTDAAGNEATQLSRTVTIQDTTKPAITAPADVEAVDGDTITLGSPTVSDVFLDTTTNNSTGSFSIGETIVRWTATDTTGNSNYDDQLVTVSQKVGHVYLTDGVVEFQAQDDGCEGTGVIFNYDPVLDDTGKAISITINPAIIHYGQSGLFDSDCFLSLDIPKFYDVMGFAGAVGVDIQIDLPTGGFWLQFVNLTQENSYFDYTGNNCYDYSLAYHLDGYFDCIDGKYSFVKTYFEPIATITSPVNNQNFAVDEKIEIYGYMANTDLSYETLTITHSFENCDFSIDPSSFEVEVDTFGLDRAVAAFTYSSICANTTQWVELSVTYSDGSIISDRVSFYLKD